MSRRRSPALVALAAMLAVAGCSSEPGSGGGATTAAPGSTAPAATSAPGTTGTTPGTVATAPADVTLDDATRARLDETFRAGFAESGLPGATARVTIGDDTWEVTLGVDDLATQTPFDPERNLRIASITKSYTGTAILELVDRGELSLDDPLEQYVPGIDNGTEITVEDLLAMTSGIWDFTSDEELVARFDADPMMAWTVPETVELIKANEAEFEPGAKVAYCDSNYVLLGVILEQVTGMTAAEAVQTLVIEPLGLPSTRFPAPDQPGVPDPATTGYLPPPEGSDAEPTVVGDINPQFAWTAGAMSSTLDDLERWGVELGEGTLLTPETQALRVQGQRFDGAKLDFGYGLGVTTLNDLVGHNGAIIGASSIVFRYQAADATFVVIGNESTNFSTPTTEIALQLIAQLYPDQVA